ncbi:MAG TPA: succinyl-diaminopimelate desuccinylase [Alphaproteobacteria bacterium]|nr:succinyl-diaminopimelate desuccinylase [Alphaproteobacteria bacterium]
MPDVVDLAKQLIACPSVTPIDAGAMAVVEKFLQPLGFKVERMRWGAVENIYARIGTASPHICFAGHTDVVPPGDEAAWKSPPFAPEIRDGRLYGRGAADMKGAIAAFLCAGREFLKAHPKFKGSLSYLITGDEEAEAVDGTVKVVGALKERKEAPDYCVVGEPSCPEELGDLVKIGRRGSFSATITIYGTQGHSAYPQNSDNPLPKMVELARKLARHQLDSGSKHFQPSNLVLTSIDTGNAATNVIPAKVTTKLNIRFNDHHSGKSLAEWLNDMCQKSGARYDLSIKPSAEPFLTSDHAFADRVRKAVKNVTGKMPEKSTTGGTSDARFIKDLCPVVEFGPVNLTAHKVDENILVEDLRKLQTVYQNIMEDILA